MNYKAIQDRCLERLRLTTATARGRIKNRINERLRAVQAGMNLGKTRVGTVSLNTVGAQATLATTGVVKVFNVTIPLQRRVLQERSMTYLRLLDPGNISTGVPTDYAVETIGASSCTLHFFPKPAGIYAVQIDGLLNGTDLAADGDIPGIPEDFHDLLIDGACADEYGDMEDSQDKVAECEGRYDKRLKELRYFLSKTAWLSRRQGGDTDSPAWLVNLGRWIA